MIALGCGFWFGVGRREKAETKSVGARYEPDPWTITSVHTNGTIRFQCGTKSER